MGGAVSPEEFATTGIAHSLLTREELLRRAGEMVTVFKERAART